jgi:hypothetical protein
MATNLNLTGFRYNIAAAVFFVRCVSRMSHQVLTCSRFRIALLRSHRVYDIKSSESIFIVFIGTSRSSYSDHRAGVRSPWLVSSRYSISIQYRLLWLHGVS